MQRIALFVALATLGLTACGRSPEMQGLIESSAEPGQTSEDFAPLVQGYYEGGEIFFIHTEASDAGVADMLTEMMGPQVVLVPALANVPDEILGNVFVFTNGVQGMGPFGFQPDVFNSVPGTEGYSPLRRVNLVGWEEGVGARLLMSVEEILGAENTGELTIETTDYVVNMPILVWPGGSR